MSNKRKLRWLAAGALSVLQGAALAGDVGPYVQVSGGRTTYDLDCNFYGCRGARGSTVKVGGGYRFGVFALEAWGTDWGRGPVYDGYGDDFLRLRSLGMSGAWRMHFGTVAEGVLRAGFASVRQTRSVEGFSRLEGTFGLGLSFEVAPKFAVELGWDLTTSTGGSDRIGSVLAQATTLGLRVRF